MKVAAWIATHRAIIVAITSSGTSLEAGRRDDRTQCQQDRADGQSHRDVDELATSGGNHMRDA
jgi:hypothetical protein